VDVAPGTRIRIAAEALGHAQQVPLRSLEIIGHGKVLARSTSTGVARLTAELETTVERGMWIAARAEAGSAQVAHTTPVYVTVNGGGFHNHEMLGARIATAERYLSELEADITVQGQGLDNQSWRHRAQIERQIVEARAILKRIER